MKLNVVILTVALAAMTLPSCVSKKNYNALETRYQELAERNRQTERDLDICGNENKNLDKSLDKAQQDNLALREAYAALQNTLNQSLQNSTQSSVNIAKLVDEVNASNKYIKQLVNAKSKSDSLNMVLTNKLTRSLTPAEFHDVNISVIKGVVYISLSNSMLYRSGSYEVSDSAMTILSKVAKIIQDYKDYDVLVEGNTDNVPITRTNIRNNWDLSALRASSVVQVLQNRFGIDPSRLTAAGRGEYNPVDNNNTESGRSRNRRTEIIITPNLDQFLDLIDNAPESSTDR